MKWRVLLVCLLGLSCCKVEEKIVPVEKQRPVRVQKIKRTKNPVQLTYTGLVSSKQIKKYSFKVSNRIKGIYVTKGQKVDKGTLLARLEKQDYKLASKASKLTMEMATDVYEEAVVNLARMEKLHKKGVLTGNQWEKLNLDKDVKQANVALSKVDHDAKKQMVAYTRMVSDIDGYVVKILNEEGEIVGAGYPVVIVRTDDNVVNVGLSQSDVKKVHIGTLATIELDGAKYKGTVSRIEQIPDTKTFTYTVEVEFEETEETFFLGSIAKVTFELGSEEGIWIPLSVILSDGVDFVYLVDENRAIRHDILLGRLSGSRIEVSNLKEDEQLVIEGMTYLKDGHRVRIIEEEVPNEDTL